MQVSVQFVSKMRELACDYLIHNRYFEEGCSKEASLRSLGNLDISTLPDELNKYLGNSIVHDCFVAYKNVWSRQVLNM